MALMSNLLKHKLLVYIRYKNVFVSAEHNIIQF